MVAMVISVAAGLGNSSNLSGPLSSTSTNGDCAGAGDADLGDDGDAERDGDVDLDGNGTGRQGAFGRRCGGTSSPLKRFLIGSVRGSRSIIRHISLQFSQAKASTIEYTSAAGNMQLAL